MTRQLLSRRAHRIKSICIFMSEDYQTTLGALAATGAFISHGIYFRDVLRGKTKPHSYSWLIWSILGAIGFCGQQADGAGPGSWALSVVTAGCFLIFLLSLRFGERNITTFDTCCLFVSLGAIPLWLCSHTPFWSMILITTIDAVAFLPTCRKSWNRPFDETASLYVLNTFSLWLSLFALENISLITALYPATIMAMNAITALVVLSRRRRPDVVTTGL